MKIQRLIAILVVLLQNERMSAARLADMFEVSVRTIYRDVETLEGAGIPIVTYTGIHGGIGILEQYKIDKKLFTSDDITTLLTSLQVVSGTIEDGKLNQTIEKIKALIPKEQIESIQLTSNQLYIDMTPWASSGQFTQNLKILREALSKKRVLSFGYTGRERIPRQRKVEPHQLVLKENSWYLRAYCYTKEEFRIFKLVRMSEIELLPETFKTRSFHNTMTDFKDWQSPRQITVDILLDEDFRERALDFCKEEFMEPIKNGSFIAHMPFVESDMGYGSLMSMGTSCKVLTPDHIQKELVRRLDEMKALYN